MGKRKSGHVYASMTMLDWMNVRKEGPSREATKFTTIMRTATKIATPRKVQSSGEHKVYWWNQNLTALHKRCHAQRRYYLRQRRKSPAGGRTERLSMSG